MDAPRHRRAAGGGDDDGSEHELSLFPGALRRRHVFFPQAVDRDERRAGRAGRLLVRALGALPAFRLSAPGARRCLMLPGFAFQPSELAKLVLVFYLAHSMAKKEQLIRTFSIGVLPHLIVS